MTEKKELIAAYEAKTKTKKPLFARHYVIVLISLTKPFALTFMIEMR